jgi:hypothetical protein
MADPERPPTPTPPPDPAHTAERLEGLVQRAEQAAARLEWLLSAALGVEDPVPHPEEFIRAVAIALGRTHRQRREEAERHG